MADVWSPLINRWAVNKADSDPRRSKIDTIQDHHTATPNKLVALGLFAPGGRTVTPNVFIAGREIWGIVPENRRAYTSGSPVDDHRSLTIEHLNLTGATSWKIAVDTITASVALHVDWARRYKIPIRHGSPGILEHRNIYEWFRRSYPTACAGPGWDMSGFIRRVATAMTNPVDSAEKQTYQKDDNIMAVEVFARQDGGKDTEWMRTNPLIGHDLAPGKTRTSGRVVTALGYQVTTHAGTGRAWGRTHARQYGNAPSRHTREPYIDIQKQAAMLAAEMKTALGK